MNELQTKYRAIVSELDSIHRDLTDETCDIENSSAAGDRNSQDFWRAMIGSCLDAANMRAAELGVTLPKHLEV